MTTLTPGPRSGEQIGSVLEGGVLTMWLRRPDSFNALTVPMVDDLVELVNGAADAGASVVVLRAEGRGFCSGADLQGDADDDSPGGGANTHLIDAANDLVRAVRDCPLPVVSAVQGACAGVGVPIALGADLTIASSKAFFMLAFTKIGLMPDGGASALVAASVGRATAMRMALLAERLTADDAARAGLIAAVHDADDFEAAVDRVLATLSAGPVVAYARTKQAINAATLGTLEGAFALEREGQAALLDAADFAEGSAAFREKRDPVFTDR